ncbi:indole-3-glycerol-phosphate synthase [Candidatus Micrarchaeota archaeon]|nr:indole-3-glycerol-phosphate synthase [Candidatus Micrarchaeota archaeon]
MDILDKFIEQAKENVESGYYNVTIKHTLDKTSLKQKILSQNFTLISEIKHASPAGEYSFDNIDVEKAAETFKQAGSDAISVVVEPKIFKGNLSNISIAKKTGLPVLFKDFVFHEKQIKTAAALGADCILLVMKVVDRLAIDINELIAKAHEHKLEVLLECYDSDEMRRAIKTDADILGINNRDLRSLHVDLNRTKEIMKFAKNKPVISESGINSRKDAEFVRACGVKGILVGTALWKTDNQLEKIRELKL